LLTNQRLATQLLGQQMVSSVFLVKALGGGWTQAKLTANKFIPRLARLTAIRAQAIQIPLLRSPLLRLAPIPLTIAAIQPKIVIEVVLLLNLILS